jgi:hypothetical protein
MATCALLAEYGANLRLCTSSYSYGCKLEQLTPEDRARVESKEAAAKPSIPEIPSVVPPVAVPGGGCAENGSCYGDISAPTGNPKTTHVNSYYRRDGTYVRSHYRSSGGRR